MPVTSSGIWWETVGSGPVVMVGLPLMASQLDIFGKDGEAMRTAWEAALADRYTLLLADYPGIGRSKDHDPATMTVDRVVEDLLAVADAAGAARFAWVGYSWSGAVGLQLAIRTDRLTALAIGGWPPLGAPVAPLLAASRVRVGKVPDHARVMLRCDDQYRQWPTFYASLGADDDSRVRALEGPRYLFFGGEGDLMEESHAVPIASRCRAHRAELETLGWTVQEFVGFGHDLIGQSDLVLPSIRAFLDARL
ncbi:alpha/beta fold hydrolase [Novosphingobium sp. Gsoil 351]|uniref:alpha/beta fold hydrolase n=1 Tax=Novosphingobium sp. Gsoil 351 TaxID=2675225 RepID=UPI0012B46B7D|nr:alpha/beta fold hydrolase [Novosphingobium sp. Gsoil 351]QGN55650.1 alpha/beta fold hydrolase [Novosphingobium sp. Gsoil 351]